MPNSFKKHEDKIKLIVVIVVRNLLGSKAQEKVKRNKLVKIYFSPEIYFESI